MLCTLFLTMRIELGSVSDESTEISPLFKEGGSVFDGPVGMI